MSTHSSILAWEIPWMEDPGGLQPMGLPGVRHDLATKPPTMVWKTDQEGKRGERGHFQAQRGCTQLCGVDSPNSCAILRPLGVKGKGSDVGICWRRELPLCCLPLRAYFWEGVCSESREEVTTPLERICHPAFQLKYQIESVLLHGQQGMEWPKAFFFSFLFFFFEGLYERTWCLRFTKGKKIREKWQVRKSIVYVISVILD